MNLESLLVKISNYLSLCNIKNTDWDNCQFFPFLEVFWQFNMNKVINFTNLLQIKYVDKFTLGSTPVFYHSTRPTQAPKKFLLAPKKPFLEPCHKPIRSLISKYVQLHQILNITICILYLGIRIIWYVYSQFTVPIRFIMPHFHS